jgi:hypothetical protein
MLLGMTCISFFTLTICILSLSVQLTVGVGLADYCQQPAEAQENFLQMPGKNLNRKFNKYYFNKCEITMFYIFFS